VLSVDRRYPSEPVESASDSLFDDELDLSTNVTYVNESANITINIIMAPNALALAVSGSWTSGM